MRKKRYLSLLIIPVIAISLAMISMPATAADGDVTFDLTTYYFSTQGIIPGIAPGGYLMVDVFVNTGTLAPEEGMHGYGLKVIVDPTVLTPLGAAAEAAGYFLYDWSLATYPPALPWLPMPYPPTLLQSVGTDFIELSEYYVPLPEFGIGATGFGKLCTLYFMSNSLTDYTEIEIDAVGTGYQDPTGDKYAVYGIDGHYNAPPNAKFYEQYTGSTWPPASPIGSDWHELEPIFCQEWTMESWNDNGDGVLSPSDQIDMYQIEPPQPGEDPYWFHVEWVNPYGTAGDGIADMWVTEKIPTPEFPLGSVAPLALIAAVAYIWWVSRRKRQEAV